MSLKHSSRNKVFREEKQRTLDFILLNDLRDIADHFFVDLSHITDSTAALSMISQSEVFLYLKEEDIYNLQITGRTELVLIKRLNQRQEEEYDFMKEIENI